MREIKFRAWDKENKKMLSWELLCINWSVGALKDNFHHAIMQFTGLKDKNNKEIYEGDIVKDHRKDSLFEVIYFEDNAQFYLKDLTKKQYGADFGDSYYRLKVIGNIYENPDLLK